VSVGEDGSVCVWQGGNLTQSIPHPGGMWCVAALPDGDFATGCDDGLVRVFTRAPERADAEAEAAFVASVAAAADARRTGPSDVDRAKLPSWDDRAQTTGTSEGQVQMFNKGRTVIAAQWSAASGAWIEVGEVTGSSENAGTVDGVAYEHVFPIEIDKPDGSGVVTLQIGYNNGENPFVAATRFVDANYPHVQRDHTQQIADYVTQRANATAPTLGMGGPAEGAAPVAYTGATPPPAGPTAAAAAAPRGPQGRHYPFRGSLRFDGGSLDKCLGKITEFSAALAGDGLALSDAEAASLAKTVETLGRTSYYHASAMSAREVDVVAGKMLAKWPADKAFPAVDVLRFVALHPAGADALGARGVGPLLAACDAKCGGAVSGPLPLLLARLCANLFANAERTRVAASLSPILDVCLRHAAASTSKPHRLALATVLLNATAAVAAGGPAVGKAAELAALFVRAEEPDDEALFRALAAAGTLAGADGGLDALRGAGLAERCRLVVAAKEDKKGKVWEAAVDLSGVLG